MNKPVIAIPMGDASGVGPEIIAKSVAEDEIQKHCYPLVIGNKNVMEQAIAQTSADLSIMTIAHLEEIQDQSDTLYLIHMDNIDIEQLQKGEVQAQCGQAAFEYIEKAVDLTKEGRTAALATPPINKESLKAAEVPYIGHTEMLGAMAGIDDPLTMFEVHDLRIFFLTRHVSIREAINQMTSDRVYDYLVRCDQALQHLGIENRKIAVAGLNPHSGENGLFGTEEIDEINPGIQRAQEAEIVVEGPVPADSVFYQALNGKYDAVLSLYHDQGHIAAKMTDFEKTISVTNGLPFLRTSVDHGTAFDIAGTGKASAVSMVECIKLAAQYAPYFITNQK
ncbi:4-hydroxythreonine-4-phosphate dehydrogenase PdxA [Salicibibacter cibi]|uniref:4-hydroxythreonine-4-phosphate dehydrogenase PdxA n=1 Tax=Salicibibacter cibi TaxID=2743001 RepID=A0A7T6Z8N8_9BACI|nr:4-hydroxythreonine-4-phosphate dehydrogenase PdxA [Salicibibacter cibi]QQK78876.1 4-hydroxythreonine-4-phosphate dehydrogenase PdxA [Salicibibacter cibi]